MLLLIDFEKAFDSVNFQFIVTTLEIFGFGKEFIRWITIILGMKEGTNFQAVTVVNGNISKPFDVKQGCRQGDSISGYLFILVIEILALLLEKSKIRPHRTKNNIEHLMDIYANDLTMYLEYDGKSNWKNKDNVREVLSLMEKFYVWSGLKINLGKTYVTIFGRESR